MGKAGARLILIGSMAAILSTFLTTYTWDSIWLLTTLASFITIMLGGAMVVRGIVKSAETDE